MLINRLQSVEEFNELNLPADRKKAMEEGRTEGEALGEARVGELVKQIECRI